MFIDGGRRNFKKFGHLFLAQPDSFILYKHLNFWDISFTAVEEHHFLFFVTHSCLHFSRGRILSRTAVGESSTSIGNWMVDHSRNVDPVSGGWKAENSSADGLSV